MDKMSGKKKKKDVLNVRIITLGKVLWEGEAETVSADNTSGNFDILPYHANFITILKESPIVINTKEGRKEFSFPRSLLYAKDNSIKIYAGV